jgi:hypothetical protein
MALLFWSDRNGTNSLIGLFNSFDEAEDAANHLAEGGIPRADIDIHANDDSSQATDGTLGSTDDVGARTVVTDRRPADEIHEHKSSGIAGFFKRLFGDDDVPEEVGHYHESLRRGHALLSVDVSDESRVDVVRALNGAGAIDIDERVAQ